LRTIATEAEDRSAVSRIDQTLFVLQAVTTVANAADFIPGLRIATQLAYSVADTVLFRPSVQSRITAEKIAHPKCFSFELSDFF
jgi:hypothetical protein